MITQRPQKGSILKYDDNRGGKIRFFEVLGAYDRDPNILRIKDTETGKPDLIIWKFHDGLNAHLTLT